MGPDGKPWDPERRAQRQAERAQVNTAEGSTVETQTPPAPAPGSETPTE
jgi:hypothetical protein